MIDRGGQAKGPSKTHNAPSSPAPRLIAVVAAIAQVSTTKGIATSSCLSQPDRTTETRPRGQERQRGNRPETPKPRKVVQLTKSYARFSILSIESVVCLFLLCADGEGR